MLYDVQKLADLLHLHLSGLMIASELLLEAIYVLTGCVANVFFSSGDVETYYCILLLMKRNGRTDRRNRQAIRKVAI